MNMVFWIGVVFSTEQDRKSAFFWKIFIGKPRDWYYLNARQSGIFENMRCFTTVANEPSSKHKNG